MRSTPFLQVALNGDSIHPAAPRTARALVRSGLEGRCRRVLIEPLDADPDAALHHAAQMEDIVVSA
jgi:hypothetical protein